MSEPLISVVILNWNGLDCITDCIESVEKALYKNIEIIVIDNASTDGSQEIVKTRFPNVKLLELKENIGFAAGNNRGFKKAQGKFVATLNNDVVVTPTWLDQPVEFFENEETVGIIACRQMNFYNREMIDCLYTYPLRSLLFNSMGTGKIFSQTDLFCKPGYVIGAGGASAIYRKKMLDELGGFDERYFSYHEESDLCMRAFLTGWKCLYSPLAVVYHRGSFSYNRMRRQFVLFHERNRIWFIYKFFPFEFIVLNFFPIVFMLFRLIRVYGFKRKAGFGFISAWLQGLLGKSRFHDDRKMHVNNFKEKRQLFLQFLKYKKLEHIS
jgi:GT2 family glycosyltransferase